MKSKKVDEYRKVAMDYLQDVIIQPARAGGGDQPAKIQAADLLLGHAYMCIDPEPLEDGRLD